MPTALIREARDEASIAPGHVADLIARLADALEAAHRRAAPAPARRALTPRQAQLLHYLREHIDAVGYAPTLEDIAGRLGVRSLATVYEHLKALEAKGWITREHNRARAIQLVGEDVR